MCDFDEMGRILLDMTPVVKAEIDRLWDIDFDRDADAKVIADEIALHPWYGGVH